VANSPIPITIYHNPACGTSRNVLALTQNAGIEPNVIEYSPRPKWCYACNSPPTGSEIREPDLGTILGP
jgi:hypothetical protein